MPVLNPDERTQEVQWITGSGPAPQTQPLSRYVPNADAQFLALANEVANAAPRTNGWVAPVAREAAVGNPYYTPSGGLAAYQQTGLMPPIMQSSPYATAAYGVGPDGSVSALVGFPSRYPHVLNVGLRDYMAPLNNYMAAFNQQALDLLRARGGVGGGMGVGGGRVPSGPSSRTPVKQANLDIRTSNDRSYEGWPGPMSEEEAAMQHATSQLIDAVLSASPDIRTSNDRSYEGWRGPMSEEEAALQHAMQQAIAESEVAPTQATLYNKQPIISIDRFLNNYNRYINTPFWNAVNGVRRFFDPFYNPDRIELFPPEAETFPEGGRMKIIPPAETFPSGGRMTTIPSAETFPEGGRMRVIPPAETLPEGGRMKVYPYVPPTAIR